MKLKRIINIFFIYFILTSSQNINSADFGQIFVDALKEKTECDFAFINYGVFENLQEFENINIIKDKLKFFNDKIVILKLKGSEIKKVLEYSIRTYPKESLNRIYISGLKFDADYENKFGERILKILPLEDKSFDTEKEYTVATNKFLAEGELGYFRIFNQKNIIKETEFSIGDIIKEILENKTLLYPLQ